MVSAKIYFSDKSSITINESDRIVPIVRNSLEDEPFASMGKSVEIYTHTHDGLIPALMNVFCFCDFFYVNGNMDTIYSTYSIVKIEKC